MKSCWNYSNSSVYAIFLTSSPSFSFDILTLAGRLLVRLHCLGLSGTKICLMSLEMTMQKKRSVQTITGTSRTGSPHPTVEKNDEKMKWNGQKVVEIGYTRVLPTLSPTFDPHTTPPISSISCLRRTGLVTSVSNLDERLTVRLIFSAFCFPLSGVGSLWFRVELFEQWQFLQILFGSQIKFH